MKSNNTSYKFKAYKSSSREVNDSRHNSQSDDNNYENESTDGDAEPNHKSHTPVYPQGGKFRGARKVRSSEFRSTKSNDHKNFRNNRVGPGSSRKTDRDNSNNFYILNRSYNDRSAESSGLYHGKFYESDKKNYIKLNLPEDTRISKLLRRLTSENDQENSLVISKKLLEVLLLPDNANYVRKAFHILGESMFEILQVSPGPLAKHQAARALGRMGYIMGQENDFERYQSWLFIKMAGTYDEIQVLLMKSIKETLAFEKNKPVLTDHAEALMHNLVSSIETIENVEVFKAILDTLVSTVELYSECFYGQFQDTVDLLFGWHVDHTQTMTNIEFISRQLQKLSPHFKYNLEFAVSLIKNFTEDITNFSGKFSDTKDAGALEHVTVFILALNTVLKCLGQSFHPVSNKHITVEFVTNCFQQIVKILSEALETFVPHNLVIAANESIGLLLEYMENRPKSLIAPLYTLIDLELSLIADFSTSATVSILLLISRVIKELSTNLPIEYIDKLIGPNSEVVRLRNSNFKEVRDSIICVYQTLLNLKNVSLLQETYRYILGDLEVIYRSIVPNVHSLIPNNPFDNATTTIDVDSREFLALFMLRCLSQLANASSIIVMWALKPSILELIGTQMKPHNEFLAKNNPGLQFSLLHLLYSHCKCYNHFITSSSLVSKKRDCPNLIGRFTLSQELNVNDVPNTSPNLGNFEIILDILYKTLSVETTCEVTLLLMRWLKDILTKSDSYLEDLYDNDKFRLVTEVLVKRGHHFDSDIVSAVCENLDILLGNKQVSWSKDFLVSICDLCKLHLNSNKQQIQDSFSKLSSNIPWDVAIIEFNKPVCSDSSKKKQNIWDYNCHTIWLTQHLNSYFSGEIYPLQFKTFMNYLLKNEFSGDANWLEDVFVNNWPLQVNPKVMDFLYQLGTTSKPILCYWATLESAQFCVNYKLRTPLGKPNETFTKIESALNQIGNDLISAKKIEGMVIDSCRVQLLLQFVENLEKSIYNASEGCAVGMQQPNKQVRSFFVANINTCNEWMSRIRLVVIHIAMHAGDPSVAFRHGQALLNDLVTSEKTSTPEFEKVVMLVTSALLSLKEPEAINGLYVWCKNITGKKMLWIKAAAEQASKKYELAIEDYQKLLSDDEPKKLSEEIEHFIFDQVVVCYKELGTWVDLINFNSKKTLTPINGRKYSFTVTDWDCIDQLFNVEVGRAAFNEISTWANKPSDSWSKFDDMTVTESNLYRIAFGINSEKAVLEEKLNDNLDRIEKSIRYHLNTAPTEFLQNSLVMQYVTYGLKRVLTNTPVNTVFLVSENFENDKNKIESSVLRKMLWWSEYFASVQDSRCTLFCTNLRLDVIKRARKERNTNLALSYVHKFLRGSELAVDTDVADNIASVFLRKINDVCVWNVDTSRIVTEIIKLSYCMGESRQNTFNLCAAASTEISKRGEMSGGLDLKIMSSKILLKLANWLQLNEDVCLTDMSSHLGKLLMVLPEIGQSSGSALVPMHEMAVGKLLQFSVHQSAGLAKGWNVFGTWCYRWGRKMVDHRLDAQTLTDDDQTMIKLKLGVGSTKDDFNAVTSILSQSRSSLDDEDIESNTVNTSEIILSQLRHVSALRQASEDDLCDLVQIWRKTQKRLYTYYALSAEAYFKYLHLTMNSENGKNTEYSVITVTLRLLRLIVKYALELQNILEEGLKTTPTQPWKVIIPQLFSRLNHPESYVCHRVSDLLCRIAEDAPHLITFPAVIGALEGGLKFDFSEISLPKDCLSQTNEGHEDNEDGQDEFYDSDNEDSSNALQICFKTMVDTLSKQDPETIAQVQSLVKELRRITLLWDELWLGTLAQHQTEISKRQHQLEYEIEKVNENPNLSKEEKLSLITEKHRIIIKPIVFILEQLNEVTSVEAETPHEKGFQESYLKVAREVIAKLKNPENAEKPQESLQPLKTLQKQFQQKFHRRSSYTLKMHNISPVLASIKNTLIAMPGLTNPHKAVTISHVSNIVSILPTKTKPKKLVFYGSDGQSYTYLFKGLEDLHLDERIMQFLSIANTMMAHNSDIGDRQFYTARHYSVIPLGPRSGLISWVDGTTPAFALYKRWQQREVAKPNTKNSVNTSTSVLRPSELFYNKLNPLLKEHGIKNLENRKEWPLSVLKQVLTELMTETPNDLLAKELWCNAISANVWWHVVKRYSYSVAVMSIIGYIIGLGDRHLDNVLIDLTTGEVVHIDYNVCFEKGKTLRVPEKVPFRLTPNIQGALGVTGVEGIFRTACENVLKTMRKGRETLLTLLEAFVYDPLIDWTVGGEVLAGTTFRSVTNKANCRQNKRDLEKDVTLSMFNVRCTEMKVEWDENRKSILDDIPFLRENYAAWIQAFKTISATEDYLQDLHQQMALIKEAEAHGASKHSLFHLPSRYEIYSKAQDAIKSSRKTLDEIITDAEEHVTMYNKALKLIENPLLVQLVVDVAKENSNNGSIFDLLKEFLCNAGQTNTVTQCEKSENEVEQLSQLHRLSMRRCLQLLQEYNAILSQCSRSYLEHHRVYLFLKWCRYLLEHKTAESCDTVFKAFQALVDHSNAKHVFQFSCSLETAYKEALGQVNRLYEDLTTIRNEESTAALESMHASARMGVTQFLSREKGATDAFKFVVANELVVLNKNFLALETTANRSGDLLIKLTRDGDWFLDDLVLSSAKAVEIINSLPVKHTEENATFLKLLNGIKIANNVYKGLHELHFNFYTIIVPESVKKIQNEEATVMQMISDLSELIGGLGATIPELVAQLEKILSCLFMQMDITPFHEQVFEHVRSVRRKFQILVQSQTETLSQGKMLLLGFNGLFDKLSQEMHNLVNTLGNIDIPASWEKLDQVKEAKSIAAHIFSPKVHAILDDIFLLKKLQAMSDFFDLTQEMCQAFGTKGVNAKTVLFTDDILVRPVRQFIADFISRQLLGVTTEAVAFAVCFILQNLGVDITHEIEQRDIGAESKVPLEEICHKAWNFLLKQGVLTQNIVSQASSFSSSLKTAWDVLQEPKKLELKLAVVQSSMLRLQNQLSVYNFMHEEILNQFQVFNTVRGKFIEEIQKEIVNLATIQAKLSEARDLQKTLIQEAYQRLNWAKGANPDVLEISAAFEASVAAKNGQLNTEQTYGNELVAAAKLILHHEILRTGCTESKNYDKLFLSSLDKWRMTCQFTNSKNDVMTATEESIMNLLTPELLKDPRWLQEISETITNLISATHAKLEEEKVELFQIYDVLCEALEKFKSSYENHCRLMADFKYLVKSMVKLEDFSNDAQQFIQDYKNYTDYYAMLFAKFKKETGVEDVQESLQYLENIEEHTPLIYDGLMNLQINNTLKKNERSDLGVAARSLPQKQDSMQIKDQQKNAYAVGVWRRVKMKLEGRDPDASRKYTSQEQVDYVIQEATNLDNLALLYEGWTPWV